jgi:predicted RNA methylase
VIAANYMAHEQVYNLLHVILLNEAKDGFVFADLACGTAPFSAAALSGTDVSRYIGIDISMPSLDVAKDALSPISFPVELRCQDFVEAIDTWEGPLDVVNRPVAPPSPRFGETSLHKKDRTSSFRVMACF